MRTDSTKLSPVKTEDFNLKSGINHQLEKEIDPRQHYQPMISQFDKLAVGPHFWFIVDTSKGINVDAGGMMEKTCNFSRDEFVNHPPEQLFKNTHPQDIGPMMAFSQHWIQYYATLAPERRPFVRPSIFIRILNASQTYYWALVQYAEPICDKNGVIVYGLTLITDISHIKKDGAPQMSILDSYDGSCRQFICSSGGQVDRVKDKLPHITPKEMEVLRLLAIGYSSKMIAASLGSAIKTIDNHRQRMLHKTQSKSTGELVTFGIKMGFI